MAHISRYGNKFSTQEWSEMQASFKAEAEENDDYLGKVEKMANFLRRQLDEMGLSAQAILQVVASFKSGMWLDDVANGKFQFSSPEKAEKINDLYRRWDAKMNEIMRS